MLVSPERLERDLHLFSSIGARPGGGVSRVALTPADAEARTALVRLMREAGLVPRIDRFGNVIGRREPGMARPEPSSGPLRPAVVIGSHLDSVPDGGRFDGVVGVIAALEVARAFAERRIDLGAPLEVVSFTAEESARFGVATLGSKAVAGLLSESRLMALTDRDGVTFEAALQTAGGYEAVGGVPGEPPAVGWFLELHVEQGPVLDQARVPLGVVTHIAAPTRLRLTVRGEAAHSGATRMDRRKDGLVAAAEIILALEQIAEGEADHGTVATATIFAVHPVSINVVPGEVVLGVDVRSTSASSKRRVVERLRRFTDGVAAQRGVRIETEYLSDEEPVTVRPEVVGVIEEACRAVGSPYMRLESRAGHDAMNIARIAPAGMIFIPSRGGLSHNPAEHTELEHIVLGAETLAHAVRLAARRLAEERPPGALSPPGERR